MSERLQPVRRGFAEDCGGKLLGPLRDRDLEDLRVTGQPMPITQPLRMRKLRSEHLLEGAERHEAPLPKLRQKLAEASRRGCGLRWRGFRPTASGRSRP